MNKLIVMCPSQSVLNRTKNGTLSFSHHSKLFHFAFNNLCFELYEWELEKFVAYLNQLDVRYWETELSDSLHQRKIPIPVNTNHFIILINKQELEELKQLLTQKRTFQWLNAADIDYTFSEN